MNITEVRIKLTEIAADRLRGFCSVTFDHCFVVRDLKIIDGNNGPFVAMPSRKIMTQCHQCSIKNHLRSKYCNHCGARLHVNSVSTVEPKSKLYADIAHPINAECREMIQRRVLHEFGLETERAKLPGYVSRYDEEYGNIEPAAGSGAPETLRRVDHGQARVSAIPGPHASPENRLAIPQTGSTTLPNVEKKPGP